MTDRVADFAVLHTELSAFTTRSLETAGWKAFALSDQASHPLPLLFLGMVAQAQARRWGGRPLTVAESDAVKAILLPPLLAVVGRALDEDAPALAELERLANAWVRVRNLLSGDSRG